MTDNEREKINAFFAQTDENGVSNLEKTANAKIIRRTADTDKNRSFEETEQRKASEYPLGAVVENGKLIGLGIHIFNEDIYPIKSFEIYLRGIDLTGELDISGCSDMVFLDLYRNRITSARLSGLSSMRILGLQDNLIEALDLSELPVCQGIDAGKNKLSEIDVSKNHELAELYVNDNRISEISLSENKKLKYFYCHNNLITSIDVRENTLLRHMDCTGNPLVSIKALAPQREEAMPLEISAVGEGYVGLKFCPVYNAQWKETGEWQQSCYAYPKEGYTFEGWYEDGVKISSEAVLEDEYGASRVIEARFI